MPFNKETARIAGYFIYDPGKFKARISKKILLSDVRGIIEKIVLS